MGTIGVTDGASVVHEVGIEETGSCADPFGPSEWFQQSVFQEKPGEFVQETLVDRGLAIIPWQ